MEKEQDQKVIEKERPWEEKVGRRNAVFTSLHLKKNSRAFVGFYDALLFSCRKKRKMRKKKVLLR